MRVDGSNYTIIIKSISVTKFSNLIVIMRVDG